MNHRLFRNVRTIVFLFVLFLIFAPARARTVTITVNSNFFDPKSTNINVGDTVTWVWRGSGHDTVSAAQPPLWQSPLQNAGATFSHTFTSAGTFPYFCTPHRAIGMTGTIVVQGAANQAPTISLTAPSNNATFSTTDTITFSADASDPDNNLSKVEFFSDGNLIGSADTTAPFSVSSTLPAGTHSITAKATDAGGLSTTTPAISITVNAPADQPPTVTITSPADGSIFQTTDTITFTANANDDHGVTKVEYFEGRTLIGTATTAPYTVQATLPAGTHSIFARATDTANQVGNSPSISITVNATQNQPPTITLSSPQSATVLAAPANITLSANATDDSGITQVEFFQDGVSLGSDTTAPYEASASNLAAGVYNFTAVAHDNGGLATASSPVQIRVAAAPQITSITQNSSTFTITANATSGISHDLEATSDFVNWTVVNTAVPVNGTVTLSDTSSDPKRFYRVVAH